MADRFIEVDYSPDEGLTLHFRPHSLSLIPEPTRQHIRAANKEMLLALRSFVDQAIDRMESSDNAARGPRRVHVRGGEGAEVEEN